MAELTVSELVIRVSLEHERTGVHPCEVVVSRDGHEQMCWHEAQELLDIQTMVERILNGTPRRLVTCEDVKPIVSIRCLYCADMVPIKVSDTHE